MYLKCLTLCFAFVLNFVFIGCSDDDKSVTAPEGKIETVAGFVTAVCELAAACPDVSATEQDIKDYVAEIPGRFSSSQIAHMERFTTYTKAQQDCILECIGGKICGRFQGSLSYMSDSDVIDPLLACEPDCTQ